jgi:hypothetical protein
MAIDLSDNDFTIKSLELIAMLIKKFQGLRCLSLRNLKKLKVAKKAKTKAM